MFKVHFLWANAKSTIFFAKDANALEGVPWQ